MLPRTGVHTPVPINFYILQLRKVGTYTYRGYVSVSERATAKGVQCTTVNFLTGGASQPKPRPATLLRLYLY